ncbi:IclR family transcriptional regulator [Luteimicrobium subarcticum]|uniref:IclR family transcriptional regulator n=1 Tax=Luteimicrobium subarcticum TaxID=620910 RepID=A0A2M8WJN6_9MICO|nr:IclR family transcriptional regulator [Luteimicrobium subarcticum]PJI91147.1 IclR family transcriptional regulator [Luteimicrobium subarcticum]
MRNTRRHPPLPDRPPAAVESLDRGLRLVQMLRDYGSVRVADASAHLDISRSSAHRLLQTLLYRGFAVQDESHVYLPGPSMDAGPARLERSRDFRRLSLPHLEVLSRRSKESANLMIRVGQNVRFLVTVRARTVDATHDRDGVVMAAHEASGGKALLAELTDDEVRAVFSAGAPGDLTADELHRLLTDVHGARAHGYAVNIEETERGVAAVGAVVHDRWGTAVGAVTLSTRSDRFADRLPGTLLPLLLDARLQIERDLAEADLG